MDFNQGVFLPNIFISMNSSVSSSFQDIKHTFFLGGEGESKGWVEWTYLCYIINKKNQELCYLMLHYCQIVIYTTFNCIIRSSVTTTWKKEHCEFKKKKQKTQKECVG